MTIQCHRLLREKPGGAVDALRSFLWHFFAHVQLLHVKTQAILDLSKHVIEFLIVPCYRVRSGVGPVESRFFPFPLYPG